MSSTLAIIKPNGVRNKQIGMIISCLETAGFIVNQMETIPMTQAQAEELYAEHNGKDFFGDLCAYMRSGLIVVMELWHPSPDAWKKWRELMGATDPKDAEPGTIRAKYGLSRRENAVHGSDSEVSAQREIKIFFDN